MKRTEFEHYINSFKGLFYMVIVWVICVAFFFSGAALALELFKKTDGFFGILLGFAIFLISVMASYPLSVVIVGKIMDAVEIIRLKFKCGSDAQKAVWAKNSRIIFAERIYPGFDELMHNYFNRKHSVSKIGKEFKYGIRFKDKYSRKLYVYVDSPPCFDAEDYLSTPKYYYVFYKKRGRIYALYTDSKSDFCLTDNHVRKLPDCEYSSTSLYEMMKHDGFFKGYELKDEGGYI